MLGQLRDGRRPAERWVSSPTRVLTSTCSSWTRRGTRTAQPLSRKWRLSSPTIVGVAKVENSRPRSGSNRSTALTRPSDATWMRSSSGDAAVGEPAGEVLGEAQVGLDELVADRPVAGSRRTGRRAPGDAAVRRRRGSSAHASPGGRRPARPRTRRPRPRGSAGTDRPSAASRGSTGPLTSMSQPRRAHPEHELERCAGRRSGVTSSEHASPTAMRRSSTSS